MSEVKYKDPATYEAHAYLIDDDEPGVFPLGDDLNKARNLAEAMSQESDVQMVKLVRLVKVKGALHGNTLVTYG